MSEPMFNSGVPGAGAPDPIQVEDDAPSNRKAILAIGGVLAALVVGGGIFYMMSSSSSSSPADTGTVAVPVHSAPAPTASPTKGATVIEPASVAVSGRDPFAPLYPAAKPVATSSPAASIAPVVVPPVAVVTTNPVNPVVVPTAPVTTPPVSTPPPTTYVVSVSGVDPVGGPATNGVATFKVNGKSYPNTALGDKFATYFLFYAVANSTCVNYLLGDVSHRICEGQVIPITAAS